MTALVASVGTVAGHAEESGPVENVTGSVTHSDGTTKVTGGYVDVYDTTTGQQLLDLQRPIDTSGGYGMNLAPGHYELVAHPGDDNALLDDSGSTLVDVPASGDVTADIRLRPSNVTGSVVAPDGDTPVVGAQIAVASETITNRPELATTVAGGAFGLALPPGDYTLIVSPPQPNPDHYAGTTATVHVTSSDPLAVPAIVLQPANVYGVVRDGKGEPVAGSQIDLYDADNIQRDAGADTSAGDGAFALRADPVGGAPTTYLVKARVPAGTDPTMLTTGVAQVTVAADGTTPYTAANPLVVTLATVNVSGVVVGTDGVTPQKQMVVDVVSATDTTSQQLDVTTTDDLGRFGFRLGAGQYLIYAHPDQDDPTHAVATSIPLTIQGDGEAHGGLEIRLRKPDLLGTVFADDGTTPIAGATVTLASSADPNDTQMTRTGADGGFGFLVDVGTYTITAEPADPNPQLLSANTVTVQVDDVTAVANGDVSLKAPTVRGHVYAPDGVTPQPGAPLTVYDLDAQRPVDLGWPSSNATGQYGFALPAGRYRITAQPPYDGSAQLLQNTITVTVGDSPLTGQDITLTSRSTAPYLLEPVSVGAAGTTASGGSTGGSISADGTAVAFESMAADLVAGSGTATQNDVYLRDLATSTTSLVSATPDGGRGNGVSEQPVVNGDGTSVAFQSAASDLVAGDANDRDDVFVRDLTGSRPATIRVSAGLTDDAGTSLSAEQPTISGDGDLVAFVLRQQGSTPGHVELCDRGNRLDAPTCSQVDADGDHGVAAPALSRDGSTLAYFEYVADEGWHLKVRTGADQVEPTDAGLVSPDFFAPDAPSLTDDGGLVAFTAEDADFHRTPSIYHVATSTTTVPTLFDYGAPAGGTASRTVISGDGSFLAFEAAAPDGSSFAPQAWVLDRDSGVTRNTVLGDRGAGSLYPVEPAAFSSDGKALVVDGGSIDDQVPDALDSNNAEDVFVAHQHTDQVAPTWPGATLTADPVGATVATLSWSAADDPSGIASYRVYVGGERVATVPATPRSYLVTGLTPDTDYTFTVQAVDGFGNVTTDGPTTTARTQSESTAGSALLSVTAGQDASADLTWDAAPATVAGLRIYRSVDGGDDEKVTDLPAGATRYHDAGLAARTTYHYHLVSLDGAGQEHDYSVTATVTTGDLLPAAIAITVPTVTTGLARLGDDVGITMRGSAGRTATATVSLLSWYDDAHSKLDATVARDVDVPLTEDSSTPGTYHGTFPITDGVARIVSVTGHVSDGAGSSSDSVAKGTPVDVSGGLHVTVADPDGAFTGGRLTAFDYATGTGLDRTLAADQRDVTSAQQPGHYDVSLLTGRDGFQSAAAAADVEGGLVSEVPLTARFPATVTVDLGSTDPALVRSVVTATVVDGSGRSRSGWSGADGHAVLRYLVSGETLQVTMRVPDSAPYLAPDPVTVTLQPGDNPVTLAPAAFPPAEVSGTVLRPDGGGAGQAMLTVTQHLDGRTFTANGITAKDGTFTVPAYQGAADIAVAYDYETKSTQVTLPATGVDFQMTQKLTYTVDFNLYTRYAGFDEQGPIKVDWRTAYHYGLRAQTDSGTGYAAWGAFGVDGSDGFRIIGRPGDTVTVCAGPEAQVGLPPGCATARLGADPTTPVPLDLHLGQQSAISAHLLDGAGAPFTRQWRAVVAPHVDGGLGDPVVVEGDDDNLSVPVAGDGVYDLTVTSAADSGSVGRAEVTVSGGTGDAGSLTLRGGRWFGRDSLADVPRNDLSAGDVADLRVLLANSDSDAADVVLTMPEPEHGTIVADAVTVAGQPVKATMDQGRLSVPLGDMANGANVSVHVPVRIAPDAAPGTTLPLAPAVTFEADGTDHTEYLAPTEARVAGVSIQAPSTVSAAHVVASGRAPAGSLVRVEQLGALLTTTTASPGGFWKVTVPLPAQGPYATYHLQATVLDGEQALTSGIIPVSLRPGDPEVTQVSLHQVDPDRPDGRVFSFDPRQGAVRFPFVIVPYQALVVDATFANGDNLAQVFAHVGPRVQEAERQPDGTWRATFDTPVNDLGDIWFEYADAAPPIDMTVQVPADQQRANLPPDLSDVTAGADMHRVDDNTVAGSFSLPSHDGVTFPITVTQTDGTATLTQADMNLIEGSGVPILNLSAVQGDDGTFTVTYDVPTVALDQAAPDLTAQPLARRVSGRSRLSALALRPQALVPATWMPLLKKLTGTELPVKEQVVKVGESYFTDGVSTAKTWTGIGANTLSAANAPNPLQEDSTFNNYPGIGGLYDKLTEFEQECPDSGLVSHFRSRIDSLFNRAQLLDNTARVMDVVGVLLAPETLGLGTIVLDGTGVALGIYSNISLGNQQNEIDDEMDAARVGAKCQQAKETQELLVWANNYLRRHRTGGLGSGVPVHDPSGYLYEGVRSNRVPGVTATLLQGDSKTGPWHVWDADWFGEVNPLTTDAVGHYGWDVPVGWWKVEFTKDGYLPTESRVVQVLPPHFDVDAAIVSAAAPTLEAATAAPDAVRLTFDQYMDIRTVTDQQVALSAGGATVPATVRPLDAEPDDAGRSLARTFVVTPASALAAGSTVTLTVDALARNYAGRMLDGDLSRSLPVVAAPGGDTGSGGTGGSTGGDTGGSTGGDTGGPGGPGGETPGGSPYGSARGIGIFVASPGGGTVDVAAGGPAAVPAGYRSLPASFAVSAPPASADRPLRLLFRVDRDLVPVNAPVTVLRDGVRASRCATDGVAEPDPCIAATRRTAKGDLLITVLSSHASQWALAVPVRGSIAPACARVTRSGFGDVGRRHAAAVACVVRYGVMAGAGGADRFDPRASLTRGQAVRAMVRMLRLAGVAATPPSLDRVRHRGRPVTRQRLATLVRDTVERAARLRLHGGTVRFRDVPAAARRADARAVAAAGLLPGRTPHRFAPSGHVRRQAAAGVFARSLALLVAGGAVSR